MTDLQCAARVLVARHGEVDYETELLTGDGGSRRATSWAGEEVPHTTPGV